jgi:hypothetical protein
VSENTIDTAVLMPPVYQNVRQVVVSKCDRIFGHNALVKMQTLERRRRENLGLKVKKEEPIRPAVLRESVY